VACSCECGNGIAAHVCENNVGTLEKWEIKKMVAIGGVMSMC
jgi:hypothetical protein